MKKFEVGHTYFDQYACDHETLSTIKIVKRTAKTVTFERHGKTRRAKLYEDCNGEYIIPDHYSMACVYRAERELLDEEPEQEVITEYAVSENLLVLTAGEKIIEQLFGGSNFRKKELDFLIALADRATSATS